MLVFNIKLLKQNLDPKLRAQFTSYTSHLSDEERNDLYVQMYELAVEKYIRHDRNVQKSLKDLIKYKTNFKESYHEEEGICEHCFKGYRTFSVLFQYWRFFSGSRAYPVVSFPKSMSLDEDPATRARIQFGDSFNYPKNKGAYGKRRLQLANFLICILTVTTKMPEIRGLGYLVESK